ncbi:GxxExxY protein [bacterium]|nr:GxxExxY protein [bacterium]
MDTDLIHEEFSFAIIGAAMEVLNHHGHGLNEKIYENSLVVELRLRGLVPDQQKRYDVLYKEVPAGRSIPDLLVNDIAIVDTKDVDAITDHEVGQVMNYLRIAKLSLGMILNFRYPQLQHRRVVLTEPKH